MKWTQDLSVGIDKIDDQHKSLFKAVNDLFDACGQGHGRQKIGETIKFLSEYVNFHFGDEEKLLLKYGYPEFKEHKKLHDDFKKNVADYFERLEKEGPNIALVAQFNTFISNWLIYHISKEDQKYARFIREEEKASK